MIAERPIAQSHQSLTARIAHMLTPGHVSEITGIPSSTLRRYASEFSEYLSAHANKRRRLYTDRDIAVITQIRELADSGVPFKEIPEYLEQVIDVEPSPDNETEALALPGLVQRINEMRASWEAAFDKQKAEIERLNEQLDQTANKEDVKALRKHVEQLESALNDERSKPWYKRLFGG